MFLRFEIILLFFIGGILAIGISMIAPDADHYPKGSYDHFNYHCVNKHSGCTIKFFCNKHQRYEWACVDCTTGKQICRFTLID